MDWFLYDIGLRHERVKEISVLKEATTHSNIDTVFGKAQSEGFYTKQLRFMNEE